jgi:hypothetical protein
MIADIRDSMPGYEGKFDVWNGRFLNTGLVSRTLPNPVRTPPLNSSPCPMKNPGGFEIYLKTTAAGLKPSLYSHRFSTFPANGF